MTMNWRAIWTVVRKDLKVVMQSRSVMLPIILVPLLILVVLPGVIVWIASHADIESQLSDFQTFLDNMPASLTAELGALNDTQRIISLLVLYFFAPLYLIVPLMVASVIAADSFAGEKERKTLEALIYTPLTDMELFVAKMLAALIPAVTVSLVGFVGYGLVANVAAWSVMERIFFPNLTWLILVFWVSPAAAGVGLGTMVLVSSKVRGFQEAYQLGGMVVIPVVLLLLGQAAGVIYFSTGLAFALGLILWLVALGLLWYGVKSFRRGELIARL